MASLQQLISLQKCSLYVKPKKMGKFLGKLEERGYAGFINVSNDDGISYFEN